MCSIQLYNFSEFLTLFMHLLKEFKPADVGRNSRKVSDSLSTDFSLVVDNNLLKIYDRIIESVYGGVNLHGAHRVQLFISCASHNNRDYISRNNINQLTSVAENVSAYYEMLGEFYALHLQSLHFLYFVTLHLASNLRLPEGRKTIAPELSDWQNLFFCFPVTNVVSLTVHLLSLFFFSYKLQKVKQSKRNLPNRSESLSRWRK